MGNLVSIWDILLLSMELYSVAFHLNRLSEAILIDDTMYSLIRKMLQVYIKFSLLSGVMVYQDRHR